ncbi:MAG: hypothetical protein ABJF11_18755 [Reichenbachiella sp.]|uniref:hypothetical protein n=1 Tax=Reichenbachiella sp. TaxID=2184521 RepID=UPI003267233B
MKKVKNYKLVYLVLGFVLISCSEQEDPVASNRNGNLVVNNDSDNLSRRILTVADTVDVVSNDPNGKKKKDFTLVMTSEIACPEVNGETLMANSLDMRDNLVAVSYGLRGDAHSGAVDLMSLNGDNLMLNSQVISANADVNAVYFDGSKLYFAGAASSTDTDSTAYVYQLSVKKNQMEISSAIFNWLGGNTATGLVHEDKQIYVTTGDNESTGGGLHVRSENDLSFLSYKPLHDARWVDIKDKKVYVQQGTPGNLSVIGMEDNQVQKFGFAGLNTPESKSTFDISGDLIFLASGYDGVQIVNRKTGTTVGEIAIPEGSSSDVVSNSVSVEGDKIFISNGESVIVAEFDNKNTSNPSPEIIGTLDLGDHQSINHVRYRSNRLVIASGLGGVKVIKLINK